MGAHAARWPPGNWRLAVTLAPCGAAYEGLTHALWPADVVETAGSNATADSSINWAEGQAPSSINDSTHTMMARVAEWRDDVGGVTTGDSSTAYTITSNRDFTS